MANAGRVSFRLGGGSSEHSLRVRRCRGPQHSDSGLKSDAQQRVGLRRTPFPQWQPHEMHSESAVAPARAATVGALRRRCLLRLPTRSDRCSHTFPPGRVGLPWSCAVVLLLSFWCVLRQTPHNPMKWLCGQTNNVTEMAAVPRVFISRTSTELDIDTSTATVAQIDDRRTWRCHSNPDRWA